MKINLRLVLQAWKPCNIVHIPYKRVYGNFVVDFRIYVCGTHRTHRAARVTHSS